MTRQEEKQMKRIAKFHKVSKERFTADWIDTFAQSQEEAEKVYEEMCIRDRDEEDEKDMVSRPPVVCVMGHVDHEMCIRDRRYPAENP